MERLENFGVLSSIGDANLVLDVDRGIQRAEDDLLPNAASASTTRRWRCSWPRSWSVRSDSMRSDLKAIELTYLKRASYPAGAIVFRENEVGDEVLMVMKGTASAYLQMPNTNTTLGHIRPRHHFLASLPFLTKACAQRRSSRTRSLHAVR